MKQITLILLAVLNALIFPACNSRDKQVEIEKMSSYTNSISIVKSGTAKFALDSVTTPMIQALQEYSNGKDNYLVYLNEETGTLYINDIITKKIIRSIEVKDGTEDHNKEYQGFYYHNPDSIFMIAFKPKITLINDRGEVKREYTVGGNITDPSERMSYLGLWSSTTTPSTMLYNDTLYINSVVVGGKKSLRKNQILLNVKTGRSRLGNALFPASYDSYNFGGNNFDIYANCVNTKDNVLVYSFPGYEKVVVNELEGNKVLEKPAGSQFISFFTEYSEKDYSEAKSNPTLEYFMTTSSYGGIYYDKYRDLYYRLALLPVDVKNVNYEERNRPFKQVVIVVLDKDFKYLGEQKLEKNNYEMFSAFVSKEGFNIQSRPDTDETLDFTIFTVKPKEGSGTINRLAESSR